MYVFKLLRDNLFFNTKLVLLCFQDNYNVLHISAMYSREDVVKLLLSKRGVDPYSTGGVSRTHFLDITNNKQNIVTSRYVFVFHRQLNFC